MVPMFWKLRRGRQFGFGGERGQSDGEAADHVQRRRDHATMQYLANRIADQLRPHVESQPRCLRVERFKCQTEHAIEQDHLFEGVSDCRFCVLSLAPISHIGSRPFQNDGRLYPSIIGVVRG